MSATLSLRERDFEAFFSAPQRAYGKDSAYVSPMKADLRRFLSLQNPLFVTERDFTYFTAHRENRPVGRIVAHVHRAANEKFGLKRAYFGFFDVADDAAAADLLLAQAEAWARERGYTELWGNFNLTAMQQMGVLIDGFESAPYVDFVWNPSHTASHLERAGFQRDFFMTTYEVDLEQVNLPQMLSEKVQRVFANPEFAFVKLQKNRFREALENIRSILNDGFANNPFFVPLTSAEMLFQAKDLSLVLDESISTLVQYKGQPVATAVCIPDLNILLRASQSRMSFMTPIHFWRFQNARDRAVLIFCSVNKSHQNAGLIVASFVRAIEAMRAAGYKRFGVTWTWDGNPAIHAVMKKMNARKLHRLCLFKKGLQI